MPVHAPGPVRLRPAVAAPGLLVGLALVLSGCGGGDSSTAAGPTSSPSAASSPSPSVSPSAAPSPSASASAPAGGGQDAAVCTKLESDARAFQTSVVGSSPKQVLAKVKAVASRWDRDAAASKDPALRTSVHRVSGVLIQLVESETHGKKVSLAALHAKLAAAGKDLQKACPDSTAT